MSPAPPCIKSAVAPGNLRFDGTPHRTWIIGGVIVIVGAEHRRMTGVIHEHGAGLASVVLHCERVDGRVDWMRRQRVGVAPPHRAFALDDLTAVVSEIDFSRCDFKARGKHAFLRRADRLDHFVFGLRVPRAAKLPRQRAGMGVRNVDQRRLDPVALRRDLADAGGHERTQVAGDERDAVRAGFDY